MSGDFASDDDSDQALAANTRDVWAEDAADEKIRSDDAARLVVESIERGDPEAVTEPLRVQARAAHDRWDKADDIAMRTACEYGSEYDPHFADEG
jgi:hypothetical protein